MADQCKRRMQVPELRLATSANAAKVCPLSPLQPPKTNDPLTEEDLLVTPIGHQLDDIHVGPLRSR